ncbi:penicillin-binding protein activator LpoA [Psychromonas marina]|uniref:Penicillin-binding protein activator LpoA n=1 Tax=Psychromonas marina TaxID=88364 RepID=A0ABQ6E3Y2_9GAMM|nr:penicillin-binding protein activator [Psychromonas marina]GLS92005.1 penicillin-binding protein activator LpoA [Psychromonas marina]
MNVFLKKRISRYLTVIATITFITACSSVATPPEEIPPALFSELEADSAFYLNKDTQLGSDDNLAWQFLAVQALIKEKKFVMADAVINSLQAKTLNTEQSSALNLLMADKFYAQNQLPETQTALDNIDTQVLNQANLVHYLKLQSELYIRNEQPYEATESMLLLIPHLTVDTEKQTYNDLLLAQLIQLPAKRLNQYQPVLVKAVDETTTQETDLGELVVPEPALPAETPTETPQDKLLAQYQDYKEGWYALAALYQKSKLRPNRLTRELNLWKATYPDHSAQAFMPLVLADITAISPYQPDDIAVLLPLTGRFARQGKAIQLGLLNAYYQQQQALSNKEMPLPKLHFFDTQLTNGQQLADQLTEANIDFVIGPLMKKEIEELLPLIENMPVLALNSFVEQKKSTDEDQQPEINEVQWHYAFPLSPEDEARQAASLIHADQHKNPLIIAPNSSYGKRVASAFKQQWAALTPTSDVNVEAHYFQSKSKLSTFIADVLQTDKSNSRIQQMRSIAQVPLETEVRSRRDVDAIYIVSKRDELILLKPFIDVTVSPFAPRLPLYASSRSHSFDRTNMQNKELTGLVFSDNPFLLDPEGSLIQEVEKAWNKQSFSTLRLFSLGVDSYQLIEQLVYLQNTEGAVYKGLIGELSLGADNNVKAKLSWAKYQDGILFEVATPITAE